MEYFIGSVFSLIFLANIVISNTISNDILKANIQNDALVFAHVVLRHGQTTFDAIEQISKKGKQDCYKWGKYLHERYGKILGEKYSPEKVYVISADYDRTIQSAQATLAGFFAPTGEEIWNDQLLWQPVPVHTVAAKDDSYIHFDKKCPKYNILYNQYLEQSPKVQEICANYGHLFPYWAKMAGIEYRSFGSIPYIYKKLMSRVVKLNEPIPDWAKKDLDKMEHIRDVVAEIKAMPDLFRLNSGYFIKDVFDRFAQKINGTLKPENLTVWMYSSHASVIRNLFNGLGITSIPFADFATIHWELYKTPENQYYIQILYKKPDEENAVPISLPGCGDTFTLERFLSVYKDLIPDDPNSDIACQAIDTSKG